jgi:hypothetical protein
MKLFRKTKRGKNGKKGGRKEKEEDVACNWARRHGKTLTHHTE